MTTLKNTGESVFTGLTQTVTDIFNSTYSDLKYKYQQCPVCLIEYNNREDLEKKVVEIRFEEERATVSCIYRRNNKCEALWIFFDNHFDVVKYLDFLKNNFVYDYFTCRWLISDYFMTFKKVDDITGCMFYK